MKTTSRFRHERLISPDREEALVALVGFQRLGAIATGLFERCQLRALELPVPEEACRYLETITPDVVVLDTHHQALKVQAAPVIRLLGLISAHRQWGRHLPLIVLNSGSVSRDLHNSLLDADAVFVPSHRQAYRHVVGLTRQQCGMVADCCNFGALPKSPFNRDAIVALHQRH